jgi:ribonuclease BN (tRNA processing enzyme)
MKLTVIGNWGAYPDAGEATSGYLLEVSGKNILLDCGSGVLSRLFRIIDPTALDAVVLSHFHHDHVADLGCLLYSRRIALALHRTERILTVFAPAEAPEFALWEGVGEYVARAVHSGESVDWEGIHLAFRETAHDKYNLAVLVTGEGRGFLYTGDAGQATEWGDFGKGADTLLCEASLRCYEEEQFLGHLSARQAAELALKMNARQLLLTHFPHIGDRAELIAEAREVFPAAAEAEIGQTYQLM